MPFSSLFGLSVSEAQISSALGNTLVKDSKPFNFSL
jgi:hypothetical protein